MINDDKVSWWSRFSCFEVENLIDRVHEKSSQYDDNELSNTSMSSKIPTIPPIQPLVADLLHNVNYAGKSILSSASNIFGYISIIVQPLSKIIEETDHEEPLIRED